MGEVIRAKDEEEWAAFWRCPSCGVAVPPLLRSVILEVDEPQRCAECVRHAH